MSDQWAWIMGYAQGQSEESKGLDFGKDFPLNLVAFLYTLDVKK